LLIHIRSNNGSRNATGSDQKKNVKNNLVNALHNSYEVYKFWRSVTSFSQFFKHSQFLAEIEKNISNLIVVFQSMFIKYSNFQKFAEKV